MGPPFLQVRQLLMAPDGRAMAWPLPREYGRLTTAPELPQKWRAVYLSRHNAGVVKHPAVRIEEMKASTYLATAPREYFDMVLADPPYDLADEAVVEMLEALRPALADGAVVVVERHRESPDTAWPAGYTPTGQKLKKRLYGIARMDMATYAQEHR